MVRVRVGGGMAVRAVYVPTCLPSYAATTTSLLCSSAQGAY